MALDEYLFGRLSTFFITKNKNKYSENNSAIELTFIHARLTLLAKAVTGKQIEIYPAEKEGGFKENNFFVPQKIASFDTKEANLSYFFFRVLYLSIQKQLGINLSNSTFTDKEAREQAIQASEIILPLLFEEFPGTKKIHQNLYDNLQKTAKYPEVPKFNLLYGKLMFSKPYDENMKLVQNNELPPYQPSQQIKTVIKAKAVEEIKKIIVDYKAQEDYVLTHNFEKVDTADEFNGVWRDFDGEDELENHQAALDELNLKYTVRVNDIIHSVYQSDFLENTSNVDCLPSTFEGNPILYKEWDYRKKNYKQDFCKLFPSLLIGKSEQYYSKTLEENRSLLQSLRKLLSNINNRLKEQRRQPQGNDFDIDAVTDLFVDLSSGHTPSEKIFLSQKKKEKDISILLLIDASLSSDSYVIGKKVLDIEKQISILYGEVLAEFGIDFSIAAFYSNTRNHSSYVELKRFEESWSTSKNNIAALNPTGYTRIGTAIRHATTILDKRKSTNKWLILLSDGKPNDFDPYEGRYGIEDTRQALREMNEKHIKSYALAIEASAKYYLPQMFGQNHYQIVSSINEMVTSLVKLYEKIKYVD